MGYFCYIYTRSSDVPHMEAFGAQTLQDAKTLSSRLLSQRASAVRAELFEGDRQVATITADEAAGLQTTF
jgi:hypothetical protein